MYMYMFMYQARLQEAECPTAAVLWCAYNGPDSNSHS